MINRIFFIQPKISLGQNVVPYHPTIGLGYIAEYLEVNGVEYDLIDMQLGYSFDELKEKIRKFRPDAIGIGMVTYCYKQTYKFIDKVKAAFPHIPLIVGGPHIMTLQKKVMEECSSIDIAIYGEGEDAMLEIVKNRHLKDIKGIYFRDKNNEIIFTGIRESITDLDKLPFPKYRKWELKRYQENILAPKFQKDVPDWANKRMLAILTSRGCPYNCIFCLHAFGRKYRRRSAKHVADELEYWYKRKYVQFAIIDDNFSMDKKRVYDLADEIRKRGLKHLKLSTPTGLRADAVDRELLKVMKEVGFHTLSYAVESASPKVLKLMKKNENLEVIEKAITWSLELGFDVGLFFVVGTPGENLEDVKMSQKFAMRFPIDARFYNLIPYPNTELFDIVKKNGYFIRNPEDYLNDSSRFGEGAPFETPELSAKMKNKIIEDVYKIKKKIRVNTYRKEYGLLGWIWAHLTFIILPVMTFVWNTSPGLYNFLKKLYYVYRDLLTKTYSKNRKDL